MIGECHLCGEETRIFEAITSEGIKSTCRICARKNNWPLVSNKGFDDKDEYNPYASAYPGETTTNIPDVNAPPKSPYRSDHLFDSIKEKRKVDEETTEVNKQLEKVISEHSKSKNYNDLVENFHWHIQQGRRMKKLSPKQLGEAIAEPEVIITMAEKGQLPMEYIKVISKIEQYLGVRLRKDQGPVKGISAGYFDISKANLLDVKTSDLKKLQEEKIIAEAGENIEESPKKSGFFSFFKRKKKTGEEEEIEKLDIPQDESQDKG